MDVLLFAYWMVKQYEYSDATKEQQPDACFPKSGTISRTAPPSFVLSESKLTAVQILEAHSQFSVIQVRRRRDNDPPLQP